MANVTITDLPAAGVLTGAESVPIVQDGVTVRTTTAAISAAPSLTQTFLTLNNEPTLPNSRYFSVGTGLGLTDNGAQSNLVLSLNGASGSLEAAGNGFISKTASNAVVARTLTTLGNGLTVTNGSGVSGNPQFALTGLVEALANLPGGGILAAVDPNTISQRTITGTASQIVVTDGSGVLGNPTVGIANNAVFPGAAGVVLPSGTTGQRSGSPVNGTIRYNTDTLTLEGYTNNVWGAIAVGAGVTSVDVSGGTTGLTTSGGPITSTGVITLAGTLITSNGGTGLSSYSAGDTLYYAAGTALSKLSIGAANRIMTSSGTAPQWTDPATITVGSATNVAGGSANQIVFNTGAGATSFVVAPTLANTYLEWSGSAFQWSANPLGTVTSVDVSGGTTGLTTSGGPVTTSGTITLAGTLVTTNGGTGLSAYTAGDTLYYGAGTALSTLAIGAASRIMTSTGTAPQWTDPTTITVGAATSATTATTATNVASGAANQILYNTGASTTSFIAAPTVANTFLEWSGSSFQWSANPLGTVTSVDVSGGTTGLTTSGGPVTTSGTITLAGTLVATNGGTGVSSYVAGDTLYYATGTNLSKLAIGSNTHIMTSTGSAPQWTNPAMVTVGSATSATSATTATTATNLAGGAAGSIPYQTALGTTAMLATSSGVLVGGTTPSYSTAPTLSGTNFTSIPNSALQNSSITLGTTAISLGGSSLTLGGLTSVAVTQDPTTALQLTTKQYVDGLIASGIHFHQPVRVESPINLNATYNNGTAGVGATLTNAGTQVALVIDGVTLSVNDRVLVYQQTTQTQNGIYVVTNVGSGSTNWILTRSSDANTYVINSANGLSEGSTVFVQEGATGAGETYTCNTSGVITFGTTNITFAQISSAQIYTAGTGLTLTGTQFALTVPVVLANGGTGLTSYTAGDLPYFASGTAFSKLAIGASNRILTSSGTAPQWTDPSTVTVGTATSATTATNVAGGAANRIVFNTASGTTSFIVAPTVSNTFLEWSGSAFQWSANPLGTVTSINVSGGTTGLTFSGGPVTTAGTITMAGTLGISNGGTNGTATPSAGAIAYGTGTAYAFSAVGNSGDVFTSAGAGAPGWTAPSSLTVGTATNATNIGITDDTTTNATMYPVWVTTNTGNLPAKVTSTKLSFNPSTGVLTATGGISGGTF